MSTQPPDRPPRDIAPPGYEPPQTAAPEQQRGHVGPWILAAAIVLVLGALAAVLVHDAGTSDTQTVITRSPTVNTTTVQRSGPTVTQATTTVAPATTVTAPAKTTTVTEPSKTVTVKPQTTTTTAP